MKRQALSIVLTVVVLNIFTTQIRAAEQIRVVQQPGGDSGKWDSWKKECDEMTDAGKKESCKERRLKAMEAESTGIGESPCERARKEATAAQEKIAEDCNDARVSTTHCFERAKKCSDETEKDSLGYGLDDAALDPSDCTEISDFAGDCNLIDKEDKSSLLELAKSYQSDLREGRRRVDDLMSEMTKVQSDAAARTDQRNAEVTKLEEGKLAIESKLKEQLSAAANAQLAAQNNKRAQEGASDAESVKEIEEAQTQITAIGAQAPIIEVEFNTCKEQAELAFQSAMQGIDPTSGKSRRQMSSSSNSAFKRRRLVKDKYDKAIRNCQLKAKSAVVANTGRLENLHLAIVRRNELRQRNLERTEATLREMKISADAETARLTTEAANAVAMLINRHQLAIQAINREAESDQKRLGMLQGQLAQEQSELEKINREERYASFKAQCAREKRGVKDPGRLASVVSRVTGVLNLCARARQECGGEHEICEAWITSAGTSISKAAKAAVSVPATKSAKPASPKGAADRP